MPSKNNKAKKSSPKKPSPAAAQGAPGSPIAPDAAAGVASEQPAASIKPEAYDPAVAKAALASMRPRFDALAPDKLAVPRLDVRAAALGALGAHAFATQHAPLHARFEKLDGAGEFRIENLERLRDAAFVVLLAHAQAEEAGAFATDVKVPVALVEEAMDVERRMQELLEYRFKKDPEIAPLLAVLRPGTGYRDLAADLLGYAEIYERRTQEVASDTTNYRPTDLADARRLGGEIFAHLSASMSPKARDAYELLRRAWTLLLEVYAEVSETGRWLLRYDPRREERFPSLFAVGRPGRGKARKQPKIDAAPPGK